MKPQTQIKRQLEAVEETLRCLDKAKESLRVDSNSMGMAMRYINNKAKLMKKYNIDSYNNLLLALGSLSSVYAECKERIRTLESGYNLLESYEKELKGRLTE